MVHLVEDHQGAAGLDPGAGAAAGFAATPGVGDRDAVEVAAVVRALGVAEARVEPDADPRARRRPTAS